MDEYGMQELQISFSYNDRDLEVIRKSNNHVSRGWFMV